MKKHTFKITILVIVFLSGFLFSSFLNDQKEKTQDYTRMAQVGIIVPDIEKAIDSYAKFFNMDKPDITLAENPDDNPTTYRSTQTDASCKLAFFNLENIQLELIQPVGGPSTWYDFLEETGGGIHHIAFWITDMEDHLQKLDGMGIKEIQRGGWTGGQYRYLETPGKMSIIVELLENFND